MEANNQIKPNGETICNSYGKPIFEIENKFITEENTIIREDVSPESDIDVFE